MSGFIPFFLVFITIIFSIVVIIIGISSDVNETSFTNELKWNPKRRFFINLIVALPLIPFHIGRGIRKLSLKIIYKEQP